MISVANAGMTVGGAVSNVVGNAFAGMNTDTQ